MIGQQCHSDTREVLLDMKGKRFSVDFVFNYFKPVLFLERYQIDPVQCKPYAVMPKQFLPGGTNSRFSHNCHNSDEGLGFAE